jgi:hypothetical protein
LTRFNVLLQSETMAYEIRFEDMGGCVYGNDYVVTAMMKGINVGEKITACVESQTATEWKSIGQIRL